jgi:hypothetical protein
MCDIDIEYFHIVPKNDSITFTPKHLIRDIIWDYSNSFIPFTNGKRYYVYQDLTFRLIDYYETAFPYITAQIHKVDETDKLLPSIIIHNIKQKDTDIIIKNSSKIMTDYINRKFSLFV